MAKYTQTELSSMAGEFMEAYNKMDPRSLHVIAVLGAITGLSQVDILERVKNLITKGDSG